MAMLDIHKTYYEGALKIPKDRYLGQKPDY